MRKCGADKLDDVRTWKTPQPDWSRRIKSTIGVSTRVSISGPGSLERSTTGKAKRVADNRPKTD